jgi:hypothetical protein
MIIMCVFLKAFPPPIPHTPTFNRLTKYGVNKVQQATNHKEVKFLTYQDYFLEGELILFSIGV